MQQQMPKTKRRGRLLAWTVIAALLVYVGIMIGPYLRSTLVRDAAVTTWIHVATSPIYGEVGRALPKPGDRIGESGRIVHIDNTKADHGERDEALAEVIEAQAVVEAAHRLLSTLKELRKRLDDQSRQGCPSELQIELDVSLAQAAHDHARVEATLIKAEAKAKTEEATYQDLVHGDVLAPVGAMLWSTIVGEGAVVDIGTPVASWIDCKTLLVDVPVADAEIALLEIGSPATVILEGDKKKRPAKVYLTRGSAATVKGDDLAALAKGREKGVAQALLVLDSTDEDHRRCPVGHAAYVEFPGIGIIDVLRARLRI